MAFLNCSASVLTLVARSEKTEGVLLVGTVVVRTKEALGKVGRAKNVHSAQKRGEKMRRHKLYKLRSGTLSPYEYLPM